MRPIFAHKLNGVNISYLLTPYSAATFVNYISDFGSSFFNANSQGSAPCVQFGSKIYSRFSNSVYEYDTIGGSNTSVRNFADFTGSGGREFFHGIYIANVTGTWYMVAVRPNGSANNIGVERYNFTTLSWEITTGTVGLSDNVYFTFKHQFGSDVYWFMGDSNLNSDPVTIKVDIAGNVLSTFNGPTGCTTRTLSLCSYRGAIYALGIDATNGLRLFQLVGGVWQLVKTINATAPATTDTMTQIFTDGTYMYAIAYYSTSGWRMWQLDAGLNAVEISSSVFPSYLLNNTGLTNTSVFKGVHIDSHMDPTNPEIWLTYTAGHYTPGSALSWFRWLGPSSQIQYVGDAGEGGPDYCIGYSRDGGGQFTFSPGEPNIQVHGDIEASITSPGNVDVPFRVYESNNVAVDNLVDVNLYYSTTPHPPRTLARLTNITPSGFQIDDYTVRVVANSGTLWNVEWRAAADNVPVGERVSLTLYTNKVL